MGTQPDNSGGAMLALYPDEQTAAALHVPGGTPLAELHVTVAYLGKARTVNPVALRLAANAVQGRPPIRATISGHARFTGHPDGDIIVALVDSPDLDDLYRDVVDALRREGVDYLPKHGYTAHCTLQYLPTDKPSPVDRIEAFPVTFSAISVVHGGTRHDLPFTGEERSLGDLAREAYAQGWAASGGPMTDRVRAGAVAAVELALRNALEPGVLEATLHLGHLEGVWAAIYDRRDALHTDNLRRVLDVWQPMAAELDVATLIRRLRHHSVGESLTEAALGDLAQLVLDLFRALRHSFRWRDLRQVVAEVIRRSLAEGQADAVALAAEQVHVVGLDIGLGFEDAYKALDGLPGLLDEADTWMLRLLGDKATELGTLLGRMVRDGASYEDMLSAATDLLNARDSRAMSILVDELTSRSLSQGALDLYASEGVTHVDFLTAGDGRVCPICSDLEAQNPHAVGDAPRPSIHPFCRCTVAATTPLGRDLVNRYVT